mmetsp:Transcript_33178/g.74002  ORF Transcript_33178/g.74002 Transcript_33178/m.74002 type:complete len:108 (-) Transcript_33178:28-351(-)
MEALGPANMSHWTGQCVESMDATPAAQTCHGLTVNDGGRSTSIQQITGGMTDAHHVHQCGFVPRMPHACVGWDYSSGFATWAAYYSQDPWCMAHYRLLRAQLRQGDS